MPSPSSAAREDLVIATKVNGVMRPGPNGGGLSRRSILTEIDHSLRRLGTDYVDLYQIHRWDYETPIEETLEALHDVVRAGKARYIGASSMHAWQFSKALYLADLHGWTRFVSMQNHYNLLYREEEREMIPLCIDQGIGIIPWSPLARGRLARQWDDGSTNRSEKDEFARSLYQGADRGVVDAVGQVADQRGICAGPGGHRLGAGEAGHHGPDRRGDEATPPKRRDRGHRRPAHARRDRATREALPAAQRLRVSLRCRQVPTSLTAVAG